MRRFLLPLAFAFSVVSLSAQIQPKVTGQPAPEYVNQTVELSPGVVHTIRLGWGVVTSLRFDENKPIDRVMLGSPVASVKVDEELNRLDLRAEVTEGKTNMIITIDGVDYTFIVVCSKSLKDVVYTRTFTLESVKAEALVADLTRMANARVLKPNEIDTVAFRKAIERARTDPVFRSSLQDLRTTIIGKVGMWNNCLVHFLEVNAFLDSDLLVFKVQFVNTTGYGLYCNSRQLTLKAAGKNIPVKASLQDSQDYFILPGQMETIWLFVQGERVSGFGNQWSVFMPPEATQVKQALTSR